MRLPEAGSRADEVRLGYGQDLRGSVMYRGSRTGGEWSGPGKGKGQVERLSLPGVSCRLEFLRDQTLPKTFMPLAHERATDPFQPLAPMLLEEFDTATQLTRSFHRSTQDPCSDLPSAPRRNMELVYKLNVSRYLSVDVRQQGALHVFVLCFLGAGGRGL